MFKIYIKQIRLTHNISKQIESKVDYFAYTSDEESVVFIDKNNTLW